MICSALLTKFKSFFQMKCTLERERDDHTRLLALLKNESYVALARGSRPHLPTEGEEALVLHLVCPNLCRQIHSRRDADVKPVTLHEQVTSPRPDLARNICQQVILIR
jgi:hypothetical protein